MLRNLFILRDNLYENMIGRFEIVMTSDIETML